MSFWNSAQSRQNLLVMLREQYGQEWFQQKRAAIMPNPIRWLANGLVNAYWRNTSGIEDIHAGRRKALPLLQRRMTPLQADTLVQNMAKGIVPSMHALYNVLKKKSEDEWQERVFSLAIRFSDIVSISKGDGPAASPRREREKSATKRSDTIEHEDAELGGRVYCFPSSWLSLAFDDARNSRARSQWA